MNQSIADLILQRFGIPSRAGHSMPAQGTLAQQLAHRSHRRFADRPVDDEVFEIALCAALSAPSKSDLQQASIVDVRDPRLRDGIHALVPAMPWMAGAPRFLVFCGDNRRLRRIAELRNKPFPNDTLDMFMNAAVDAALVMQSFITAAEALGLGCCPISLIRDEVERLGELLHLPQGVFPVAGLCVGHPADEGRLSMRLPPTITVHRDHYDPSRFDDELTAYDARRALREPTAVDKQKHVQRWGVAGQYTWSEDKARQYSVPQRHNFGSYVRAQGFALK
jgi:nitroreductase/FMN reductase [NAD(P)H]